MMCVISLCLTFAAVYATSYSCRCASSSFRFFLCFLVFGILVAFLAIRKKSRAGIGIWVVVLLFDIRRILFRVLFD